MLALRRRSTFSIILLILTAIALIHYYSSYPSDSFWLQHPEKDIVDINQDSDNQDNRTSLISNEANDPDFPLDPTSEAESVAGTIDTALCEPDECMRGSWVPREPPFRSIADFRREYPRNSTKLRKRDLYKR